MSQNQPQSQQQRQHPQQVQQNQQQQYQQQAQYQQQQQPQHQQPEQISQAHLQQSQQQYQQHQARMQQQQRELQQAAQAQPVAAAGVTTTTYTTSNRNSQQPAQYSQQQQASGTQALQSGQPAQSSSAQNRAGQAQKVPQPTVRPVKQTQQNQPTQQQSQKPSPSQPSQAQSQQQSQQQSKEQVSRAEQAHVNQQPFFRPHESASHQSRQAQQGSPVSVPARSSSIKRTGNTSQTTASNHTNSQGKSGNTPMMSWSTALGFSALGLAIFIKDPLHRRTTRVHYPKDHGGDKGQTPIGDSERLNAWKHVPVKELRVDESFWNKEKPFDWPHAKRSVVFGDETVSSAAGNAHGHPNGLNEHKGSRWTDYLYKSFMDDDALYHNLATVGSTAGDIESQIKAFQSMSAVQGSSFNSDDTLFVIGSGEEAVKPLDGSAAKAPAVTAQVNDSMKRAEQSWTAGARSFLFVGSREAGDDGRAREHWNAELGDASNKFKKAHPAANVMLFRYGDWFDAVRAHPDSVGITECKREVEPHTDSARSGYCIDTFGDETWPLDRSLSHAINGYLVKHSRAAGGKKTEASGGGKHGNKHRNHEHEKKKDHKKGDSRRKGKMGSKSS